jgi:hypothetical protein
MRRIFLIFTAITVALALVGGGGFWLMWWLGAKSILNLVEDWAAAGRASGYEVSYRGVARSGFPGTATLTFEGLEVGKPLGSFAWSWTADRVRITWAARSKNPTLNIPGTQTLTYRIVDEIRTAQFTARRFRLDLSTNGSGALDRLTLDLSAFALLRQNEGRPVTARRVQIQVALGDGTGLLPLGTEAVMLFDTLVLPDYRNGPMGDTIDLIEARMRLLTKFSSTDLPVALEDWRERGGKLNILASRLRWAGLDADAKGTLQLDEAFRPTGGFSAQIADFTPTLEAFWAAGRFDTSVMNALDRVLEEIREVEDVSIVPYDIRIENGIIRVIDILGRKVEGATLGTVHPVFPFRRSPR